MKIDLLKHNQEAYGKIKSLIADGKKKIAISHATGTGKSFLIAKLCEDYCNDKKLVLVPSRYIREQIQKLFVKYDIENVDILLYQKLIKMSDEDIAAMDYQIIVLDEYHHDAATKVWGEKVKLLIDLHSESIIFGTSATPVRTDGVNAIDALFEGNCASDLPLPEGIAKKIVPLPVYVGALYNLDDELERLRKKVEASTNSKEEKDEFYKKINAMRSQIEKSYGMPIILNKHIKDKEGKYIVFCKNKKHLDEIKGTVIGWFHTAGFKDIHSYVVHSSYEGKDKEYKAFCDDTSHALKLLFCVNMLNEGLHLENISGVLLLRPTNSSIVWHQQIGRSIEANNTKNPVIIDAVNNFSSVGQGMELLREIKDAVAREKEGNTEFDDSDFVDIDTFFVLENVLEIQEMFAEIEGRLQGREWTEEEIEILKKWYPVEGTKVKDRLQGRTKRAIQVQASKLGLSIYNSWTEEENEILKKYYPIEGIKVKDKLIDRTKGAIQTHVRKLGLKAPNNWTEKENEILREYYPIEGIKVKDRLEGRTKTAIKNQVRKLEIKAPDNSWTTEEDRVLFKYYGCLSIQEIHNKYLVNRSKVAIQGRVSVLGITYKENGKNWSNKEIEILERYYPIEGTEVANRLNGRTKVAIKSQVSKLGIKAPDNNWTEKESEILREYYPIEGIKVKDRLNGRTKLAVKSQIDKLGLKAPNNWTEKENEILREYYPIEGIKVKDRLEGRTKTAVREQVRKLGLKYKNINNNKYKYVHKNKNKYVVQFYVDGKSVRFGSYDSEEEAAKVAMEKAKELGRAV